MIGSCVILFLTKGICLFHKENGYVHMHSHIPMALHIYGKHVEPQVNTLVQPKYHRVLQINKH